MKKPKEKVKPNTVGTRGVKADKRVNRATVSPTKRPARHGTRQIQSLENLQISFAQLTPFYPVENA